MKLSVIVPVYNERETIRPILEIINSVPLTKEIVVVDDGSGDGTREILRREFGSREGFKLILHDKNYGKGRAIRSGLAAATGEAIVIQDADLEYDPMDFLPLLDALEKNGANVIYGSRFLKKKRVTPFWHRSVNWFLTFLTNTLFHSRLTDMETCYKMFRAPVIKDIGLVSDGFEIEAEMTLKLLKRGEGIAEMPISYKGRSFHEGKKIGWRDGVKAVWTLVRYRLSD